MLLILFTRSMLIVTKRDALLEEVMKIMLIFFKYNLELK